MKHQYFGDKRDLFKYDLILYLSNNIGLKNIYFIPMLTENDKSNQGDIIDYKNSIGSKNVELINFLKSNRDNEKDKRNAFLISEYFKPEIRVMFFKEAFSNKNRASYFEKIGNKIKDFKGIVFFDPDNGLEVLTNKNKHLRYIELKRIFTKINKCSIVVIYQHRKRGTKDYEWENCLNSRQTELSILLDNTTYFIADKETAFFIIPKHTGLSTKIKNCLKEYQNIYKSLFLII